MMRKILLFLFLSLPSMLMAQQPLSPEMMWSLGRVSYLGSSQDGKQILYSVAHTDMATQESKTQYYWHDKASKQNNLTNILGDKTFVQWDKSGLYARKDEILFKSTDLGNTWQSISVELKDANDVKVSPDGNWVAFSKRIVYNDFESKDVYKDLPKSDVYIYSDLNYRHWDTWNDGKISHVFLASINNPRTPVKDILQNEPYECPQQPFGGSEDFVFTPDSKGMVYVSKKKLGKEYAQSTNSDLYHYDIGNATTINLTEGMMGYDQSPIFSPDGTKLAWLSMARDGYEADKNDIVVLDWNKKEIKLNTTSHWDETVDGNFIWNHDSKSILFTASVKATQQLWEVSVPNNLMVRSLPVIQMQTEGLHNITTVYGAHNKDIFAGKMDINTPLEIVNINNHKITSITEANLEQNRQIAKSKVDIRMVKTDDGKDMGVVIVYPPNFDPSKKYPTLLYCQGGPQSSVNQFYSVRWNFQLMAAQGYIVVAPNRRGMPGWGVKWNEAISKDWGNMPMKDYLAAIDDMSKESYVDKNRLGCVGASYGGYSVYMLAGIHENRFKSFIAHNGLFDMKSWYGTTEELWFANWDLGGNYWDAPQPKSYLQDNPSQLVQKWNTPILIIQGGKDFRVPIGQGLNAFQAAQLKGIKSKLLYFPTENHWVLKPQNALVWQREFFNWLKETL